MSRKLLAFLLSELEIVRLICQRPGCKGVTEITIEKMGERFDVQAVPECPLCGGKFTGIPGGYDNYLVRLSKAIKGLRNSAESVQVEFVLPDSSTDVMEKK